MARPPFKPTAVQRRKVSIAAGGGMSHEEIALGLGITRNTLAKHFDAELSTGACAKRLDVLDAMYKAAKKGNVTAQKAYVAMTPRISAPAPDKPEVGKPRGKKEQAKVDAQTAGQGTEWGDLLTPTGPLQ